LLPELLADVNTGHNIVATVFEESRSMYRANGPVEMRPVGFSSSRAEANIRACVVTKRSTSRRSAGLPPLRS
jgi:hypothetical protein